jgi:hypothetical protein
MASGLCLFRCAPPPKSKTKRVHPNSMAARKWTGNDFVRDRARVAGSESPAEAQPFDLVRPPSPALHWAVRLSPRRPLPTPRPAIVNNRFISSSPVANARTPSGLPIPCALHQCLDDSARSDGGSRKPHGEPKTDGSQMNRAGAELQRSMQSAGKSLWKLVPFSAFPQHLYAFC